jgi:hypothetical protein
MIDSSSEDEEQTKRQRHPDNYDPNNKLKLSKFHRVVIKKQRTSTNKKRIRDLERMLAKLETKMPADVKQAKLKELKELKKDEKSKREAEKFESRYKKIKFFEKKKIIRRLEQLEKQSDADVEEKKRYKDYLIYVNNFPETKKYIALFPKEDSEKSKEKRDIMLAKILKIVDVKNKIREKELLEIDKPEQIDESDEEKKTKNKVKEIEKRDAFFASEVKASKSMEKKVVQRNGFIIDPNPKPKK